MERRVPATASEEIELYIRTIYSLLRSTTEVQIRTLEETHAGINSLLHPNARKKTPDASAFIYSVLRLPACMPEVRSVILGQSSRVFADHGYLDISEWEPVSARARRRRCLFNREDTLACFIASRSDIDDVVPVITAYQIEWNKLHNLLKNCSKKQLRMYAEIGNKKDSELAKQLKLSKGDLRRLKTIWGDHFYEMLLIIKERRVNFHLRLLSGSLSEYWRATRSWWDEIEKFCPDLLERPVYFVSSNNHSIANLLSGFVYKRKDDLVDFLHQDENKDLLGEWEEIKSREVPSSMENFLYYVLKKYQQSISGVDAERNQHEVEMQNGIYRIDGEKSFDIEAQVIDLSKLNCEAIDPRLSPGNWNFLSKTDAYIINIDYPLGLAGYNILSKIAEHIYPVLGVYIMGKAATLNGVIGDLMIPDVVQDEHSENTYLFQNAFTAEDVVPFLVYGTVLDHQKAVSVLGTFLQNGRIMDVIYREGFTDIEMEAGPYLSAVYEMTRPKRHPINEIVNLYGVPFDIGILHYASDTPLSKGKNLGAGTLSYAGMDSTYAASLAILQRIFAKECQRVDC